MYVGGGGGGVAINNDNSTELDRGNNHIKLLLLCHKLTNSVYIGLLQNSCMDTSYRTSFSLLNYFGY